MNDFVVPSDDSRHGGGQDMALGWMVSNIRDNGVTSSTRLSCWKMGIDFAGRGKSWSRLKEALLLYKELNGDFDND
jgi:hypothetical protein